MRGPRALSLMTAAALLIATGCRSSSRFVTAHVEASADVAPSIVQLQLQVTLGDTTRTFRLPEQPTSAPLSFPKTLSIEFGESAKGDVLLEVTGVDAVAAEIASARGAVTLPAASEVVLSLGAGPLPDIAGTIPDFSAPDDLTGADLALPDRCHDAVKNGPELAIDCGGDCAAKCPEQTCSGDASCVTGRCDNGYCQLAAGPPFWQSQPSMLGVRQLFGCVTAGSKVFAIGGNAAGGVPGNQLATVESFVPGAAAWTSEPALPSARGFHSAFVVNGIPYSAGGVNNSGAYLGDLVALQGASWVAKTSSPSGLSGGPALPGGNGKFYLPIGTGVVYDAGNDSWGNISTIPNQRYAYAGARGADDKLYALGGVLSSDGTFTAVVNAYDIAGNSWATSTALPVARAYATAVTAPDGQLYAISGSTNANEYTADVMVRRPAENRWLSYPSLSGARTGACATVGPDGRIFVLGGEAANVSIATVESYGPLATLGASSGAPGGTITVTGANFAANAAVSISFDGTLVRTVPSTSPTGTFSSSFVVPPGAASGAHTLGFVDVRAQYPVTATFTVP